MHAPTVWRSPLLIIDRIDGALGRAYGVLAYRDIWLYLSAALFVHLIRRTTPFSMVLREDAYNFVIKGLEIANGDFSLDRAQAIGWPLVLGAAFLVMDVRNLFEAMFIARWASILCVAAALIVLGKLCREALGDSYAGFAMAVVITFGLTPVIGFVARSAMTEAPFLLCVVSMTLCLVSAVVRIDAAQRYVFLAGLTAALSYYVRPNGLFLFAAMLSTLVLVYYGDRRRLARALAIAAAAFLLLSLPYLYARYASFGSPLDYGPNSKYFVDEYEQVWADNIASPSLWSYLATHSWHDVYERFVDDGLLKVLRYTRTKLLPQTWIALGAIGAAAIFILRIRRAMIFPMTLAVSIAGMAMIFAIFASIRHLIYFVPLLMVCAGFGFVLLARLRINLSNIAATGLIVAAVANAHINWLDHAYRTIPEVKDHWAVWAAQHFEGNVAIIEGGDLIEMSEHYEPRGWRVIRDYEDVTPRIHTIRPGVHADLGEALAEFEKRDIRYLVTDRGHLKRRPYLMDVDEPEWRGRFRHIGHFPLGDKGAQLAGVDLYEIVY